MLSGNISFLFGAVVLVCLFLGAVIYFARKEGRTNKPVAPIIPKPPLTGEPKAFSKINIYDYVREKLIPQPPEHWPENIKDMTVIWGEPEDTRTVELYLALSYDERAAIKRFGLNEEVLDEEPLFTDTDLERLEAAQQRELRKASDARTRAALQSEHQHQLAEARRERWGLTVEYYLAYPFTKTLPTPYQATLYRKRLETKVLRKLRDLLKEHVIQ